MNRVVGVPACVVGCIVSKGVGLIEGLIEGLMEGFIDWVFIVETGSISKGNNWDVLAIKTTKRTLIAATSKRHIIITVLII